MPCAAVAAVHLQGWGLGDSDMRHLEPLQQLRCLALNGADPWLLSDAAILQAAEGMPALSSITRGGTWLLHNSNFMAAAASPTGSSCHHSSQPPGWSRTPGSAQGSCIYQGVWAGGDLPSVDQSQSLAVVSPWLWQHIPKPSTPGATKQAAALVKAAGRRRMGGSSGGCMTLHPRLLACDERFRYSSDELLALRPAAGSPTAPPSTAAPAAGVAQLLPSEIRGGARW